MYYYENTKFQGEPFIERIEEHLPFWFTNEMRRMSYFSFKAESFIVFNYNSSISHPKEDVTFYVALGN
jgi:hypothetical protein